MMRARTGFAFFCRLVATAARKAWPRLRVLLVIAIALSMAEFVALDVGLVMAADLLLYLEIALGAWAIALVARFMPALSTALVLLPARIYGFDAQAEAPREEADAQR